MVSLYLVVFIVNLVTAGLSATRLSSRVKLWLALVPAILLFIVPFLLAIPVAVKNPDRNYFEVFQALYRLFRFTKPELFAFALLTTFIAVGLNIWAALILRKAPEPEKVNDKIRNRYFIYVAIAAVLLTVVVGKGFYNSSLRSLDRASCNKYAALKLPQLDEEVPVFLSDIRVIGESAGTGAAQNAFLDFSDLSRQYFESLSTEENSVALNELGKLVAAAKSNLVSVCSEYGVK